MKDLIISADNFEDSELLVPYYRLKEARVEVDVMWFKRNGHLDKRTLSESEVSYEQRCYPATIHPAVQG